MTTTTDLVDLAVDLVGRNPVDAIIISGRWKKEDVVRFKATIKKLAPATNKIFIFGPTMEYKKSLPSIVVSRLEKGENQPFGDSMMGTDASDVEKSIISATDNFDNVQYFSLLDSLCVKGSCRQIIKSTPIAFDYGHFTYEGVMYSLSNIQKLSESLNNLTLKK